MTNRSGACRLRRLLCCALLLTAGAAGPAAAAELPRKVGPFIEYYCLSCHDSTEKKGGLDLSALTDDLADLGTMNRWVRVHDRAAAGEMPPRGRVPADEKAEFVSALAATLTKADLARRATVLRRLNRYEYEHTLHDLLGIHTPLKEMLPEDGKAYGFDNVGSALDLSAVQLERYLQAGEKALDAAVRKEPAPEKTLSRHSFADGRNEGNLGVHWLKRPDGAVVFFNEGRFPQINLPSFRAPSDGEYRVRITGYAYQSPGPVVFGVYTGGFGKNADSRLQGYFEAPPGGPTPVEFVGRLAKGDGLRLVPQIQGSYADLKRDGVDGYKGKGLAVQAVEVEGPLADGWPGKGHRLLFGGLEIRRTAPAKKFQKPTAEIVPADPDADARRLLEGFLPLAFRRPVAPDKVAPYLALFRAERQAGAGFEESLRTAYLGALCSPDFLFRLETPGALDDYALAARLSYFLWSSAPDDTLLSLAARGGLGRPDVLRAQTERLLDDPKAARFTRHFTGQWLGLREIDFTTPDAKLYPEFDDLLHHAMVRETEGFFDEVLRGRRSLLEFVDSDWAVLNGRLAEHYRIAGVEGLGFRKVKLPAGSRRGGVLTHASVLRVSANGTTTSPVVRGAWVLDRILGEPPPPPPPGVPGVEPDIRGATTLREQLAKHRNSQSCAACHDRIDPPGFALENYDVMGGWRTHYRSLNKDFPSPPAAETSGKRVAWRVGPRVDASGATPDGQAFRGLEDYKRILLADPDRIARALAERVATYASGRGMGFSDRPEVERIVRAVAAKGYSFRELIHEVVQSEIFRTK